MQAPPANRQEAEPRQQGVPRQSLGTTKPVFSDLAVFSDFSVKILGPANNCSPRHEQLLMDSKALRGRADRRVGHGTLVLKQITSFEPVFADENLAQVNSNVSEDRAMLKKILILSAVGVGSTIALASTGAWSYMKCGIRTASDTVRDSVPIDWEIKRARQMIEDLKPEIARNLQVVAREEVGVQRLAAEIKTKETHLTKSRSDITRLKGDLESGSVKFVYAGRSYSQVQVKEDLSNRFKQFQVHEETTSKLNQVLSAREKNLEAARRKLDGMLAAKKELEVEVENLQARVTMVEVAQTTSPVSIDDSHLSSTRQLLDDIRTRIDVAERMSVSEGALEGTIQLDEPTSENLLEEIADYFGAGRAEVESLVSAQGL